MISFYRPGTLGLVGLLLACSESRPAQQEKAAGRLELVTLLPPDPGGEAEGWLDFGTVASGGSRQLEVVFRNGGNAPIELPLPELVPPLSAERPGAASLDPGEEGRLVFHFVSPAGDSSHRVVAHVADRTLALTAASSPCSLEVSLEPIDFGSTPQGIPVTRELALTNRSPVACALSGWAIDGEGDFSVHVPGTWLIGPGFTTSLPVEFQPVEVGTRVGALSFLSHGTKFEISLVGESKDDCIVWSGVPELHVARVGCGMVDHVATATNVCTNPLRVERLKVEPPTSGFFETRYSTFLRPGEKAFFDYVFMPFSEGRHEASLKLFSRDGIPFSSLPLVGEGTTGLSPKTDRWRARPLDPIDVLVVVDDTMTMTAFHKGVETFGEELISRLQGHDFRLALVPTSLDGAGENCPVGNAAFLEDERGPAILTPDQPGWEEVVRARLASVPTCHTRSQGLEVVRRVIERSSPSFFRQEAYSWFLFVAATEDSSFQTPSFYASRLAQPFLVDMWSGPGACVTGGSRWADFGDRVSARRSSICRNPWHPVSEGPQGEPSRLFPLTGVPVDLDGDGLIGEGEMEVAIDGARIPPMEGGRRLWRYLPLLNAVELELPILPRAGEAITANYQVGCEGEEP